MANRALVRLPAVVPDGPLRQYLPGASFVLTSASSLPDKHPLRGIFTFVGDPKRILLRVFSSEWISLFAAPSDGMGILVLCEAFPWMGIPGARRPGFSAEETRFV